MPAHIELAPDVWRLLILPLGGVNTCLVGDDRSCTTTLDLAPNGSPVPLREVDRLRGARAALAFLALLAACSPSDPGPQPVSLSGTITNWNTGAPLAHLFDDPIDPATVGIWD